jgi:hypothetical protein
MSMLFKELRENGQRRFLSFCKEDPNIPCFSIDDKKVAVKTINAGDGAALFVLFAVSRS